MSNAYPSAGGIAMFLERAYGPSVTTGACALLMALTMVINESLVARTFGTYTLQLFEVERSSVLVPVLGVGLVVLAFLVNISGNRTVGVFSFTMALLKIGGIVVFALAALWAAGISFEAARGDRPATSPEGFVAAVALAILAYKGFTTITNSGSEIVDPHRNVGRAIVISIGVCVVIYTLVAFAVGASLTLPEIIRAKDFSLAQAARPAFGEYGLWFTVALAIVATASGLIASVFAVSRMLAMLTDMELIPHRHFGMPGRIQKHTLVYTVVIASLLTVFFDLSRIASLGAIFYLVMDVAVHWGVFRHLRREVRANGAVLLGAIALDAVVLGAFLVMKAQSDPLIIVVSIVGIASIFVFEAMFLRPRREAGKGHSGHG
jgi:amino acid transporter